MYGAPFNSTPTPPPPPPPTSSDTAQRHSHSNSFSNALNTSMTRAQTRPPPFEHPFPTESDIAAASSLLPPYDSSALAAAIFDEMNMSAAHSQHRRMDPPLNDAPYRAYQQYANAQFHHQQSALPTFEFPSASFRAAPPHLFGGYPSQYPSQMSLPPMMPTSNSYLDLSASQWPRLLPTRVAPSQPVSTPSSTTSSSSSSSPSRSASSPSQYQTIIECGYVNEHGERQLTLFSSFFDKEIEVYTAVNDPSKAFLYRVSALAEKIGCATNKVGMYLARRRQINFGIFQATQFRHKPAGRTGLKSGGYFLTQEACEEFEHHFTTKLAANAAARRTKRRSGSDEERSSTDDSGSDNDSRDSEGESVKKETETATEWANKPRNVKRRSIEKSVVTERETKRIDSLLSQPRPLADGSEPTLVSISGHSTSYSAHIDPRFSHPPQTQFAPTGSPQQYRFESADASPPQYAEQLMSRRLPQPYPYASQAAVLSHEHRSQYAFTEGQIPQAQLKAESPELLPHYIPSFEGRTINAPATDDETHNNTPQEQWKHTES